MPPIIWHKKIFGLHFLSFLAYSQKSSWHYIIVLTFTCEADQRNGTRILDVICLISSYSSVRYAPQTWLIRWHNQTSTKNTIESGRRIHLSQSWSRASWYRIFFIDSLEVSASNLSSIFLVRMLPNHPRLPTIAFSPSWWVTFQLLGCFVGICSGMFGIGGAVFVTPVLTATMDEKTAIGTLHSSIEDNNNKGYC